MKKALKVGLAIVAATAMTSTVYAEVKGSATGRVRSWVVQETVKDGASTIDMKSDARWGYTLSQSAGAWTASAKIELGVDTAGAVSSRDRSVTVENESMSYTLGRHFPSGITQGGTYLGMVDNTMVVGETIGRDDWLTVGLKDLGLKVVLGMNNQSELNVSTDTKDVNYKEQVVAAFYGKSLGDLNIGASYTQVGWSVDEKLDTAKSTAGADTKFDGGGKNAIAVSVGFAMGDMNISGNMEMLTEKSGIANTDDVKTTTTVIILDKGLGEGSGVSVFYSSKADDLSIKTEKTDLTVSYQKNIGGIPLYVEYSSTTTKVTDKDDATTNIVAAGFVYGF